MRKTLFTLAIGGLAVLGAVYGWSNAPRFMSQALGQAQPSGSAGLADLNALSDRFEAVARKLLPAVVAIEATKPGARGKSVDDSGSGVLVMPDGSSVIYAVTNYHVVANAPIEQIAVNLSDGRLFRPSQVLSDPETDVALLKIDGANSLPVAVFGDSDKTRVGQWVLALGSPFGLSQSVTHGIISARERGQVSLGNTIRVKEFLQTDAAINPGSSGGPLVNLNGEVIGINTAIASQNGSNSGVAFAIPINLVKRIARQLIDRGSVSHGYLGVQLSPTFDPAEAMKLGLDRARGAKVDSVVPGSPAANIGLRQNDVILQIDSVAIRSDNHLINLISQLPPGQRVRLAVWRERQTTPVDVVIADWAVVKERIRTSSSQK